MDQHLELFSALASPFQHEEVRTRSQGGRTLHYITARTVMNRLDDVLGPANWWDEYMPQQNSVIFRLSIRLPVSVLRTSATATPHTAAPRISTTSITSSRPWCTTAICKRP